MLGDEDKYAPLAIIYDSAIETSESLTKLVDIFNMASYPKELIYLIPYDESKVEDVFNSYSAVFCINSTYIHFSTYLKDVKSVPTFEFTSQQYFDRKGNLVFHGLNLTVEGIHEAANKQPAWVFIKKFVSMTKRLEVTEELLAKVFTVAQPAVDIKPEEIKVFEELPKVEVIVKTENIVVVEDAVTVVKIETEDYGIYTDIINQLQFQIDAYKRLYKLEKSVV